MDDHLAALAAAQGGVLLTAQALAGGMTPEAIRARVESGKWLVLRKGEYVDTGLIRDADPAARHRIDVAAALLSYENGSRRSSGLIVPGTDGTPRLLAGHRTAAHLWGLPAPPLTPIPPESPSARLLEPTTLVGPGTVELVNTDRARRSTRHGVRMRPATVPPDQIAILDGIPLTSRARTAVDLARLSGYRPGVFASDAALRAGTSQAELREAAAFCARWPGGRRAVRMAEPADARSESVAESLARIILFENKFTDLDLQVPLRDDQGIEVARLDIVICRWVDLEIDGKVKYLRPYGPLGEVLWSEKLREDFIRDNEFEVVRTNWDELNNRPANMLAKVDRALGRAQRRRR